MSWTRIVFTILILAIVVMAGVFYSPILAYLLISVVVSYIFDPVITWAEYRKIPRWLSTLLVFLAIGGLLAWLVATYIPQVVQQGNQFMALLEKTDKPLNQMIQELPVFRSVNDFVGRVDHSVPQIGLQAKFDELIAIGTAKLREVPQVLFRNYQSILSTIALIFTIPIFSFFILRDRKKIRRAVVSLVPNKYFELSLILLKTVDINVGNYLRAILLEMIAVGIMSTIALSIVGVPYAIVIGAIAGITNIIPYIGPWIGGIIAAIVVLITGRPPSMILWTALAVFLVQICDNYFVYPTVVGKTIKMHPLVVLLTVFAGSYFGGVIWMLVSVPLVYMVFSLVRALQINLKEYRLL